MRPMAKCVVIGAAFAACDAPEMYVEQAPALATPALEGGWVPTVEDARLSIAEPQCQVGAARWGPGDEAGQSNTQTQAKMLEGASYIRPGSKLFLLGHPMVEGMPEFPFPT